MTARQIIVPGAMPSRDRNGRALPGKLRFYSPDTTTPATVYTSNALTVAHSFPILSDSAGRWPAIWANSTDSFDVAWSDQTFDALIASYSGVSPADDAVLASTDLAQGSADAAAASAAIAVANATQDNAVASAASAAAAAASATAASGSATAAAGSATTAAGFKATSTTSLTLGTGTQALTIQAAKSFAVGDWVYVLNDATHYMFGQVTAHNTTTGALTVTVPATAGCVVGSGTFTAWTVTIAGLQGPTGVTGPTGPAWSGGTLTSPVNNAPTATVASATTTDIGAASSNYVQVTGTVTITGLGTIAAGAERTVEFAGALILTHNATSLILPGATNINTAAGDVARFISEGGGNWRCLSYTRAASPPPAASAPDAIIQDQKTAGTAGQTVSTTAWTTRNLNTLVRNQGTLVSLSSDQFTLATPGTYLLRGRGGIAITPGSNEGAFRNRFYNVTDSAAVSPEGENFSATGAAGSSFTGSAAGSVLAVVTITASKTFRFETYATSGATFTKTGAATGVAPEVYSTVEITKIG